MVSAIIDQEIKKAMLAKDQAALRGLRAIKAALLVARTEKGSAEEITEDAEMKILQRLIKQRKESSDIYKQQGREDLAVIEDEEITVISQFMPQQLSKEEVEVLIARLIADAGTVTVKDMGRIMGLANKELAGKADGKLIAEIVKSQLA
ncbi:Glutamyl-tRNA amidotransferase [Pedobacter cryoconitis]|uniref:Glutamyl-tRNA amidotransferase n=1 Tax=Pedobacter cryoconitis TaxID=188932 RepID=A0A127VFV4_9SPHI|nr:GatB/YqeY domain-containing protein [Pedobacter cryoconitis]AMQ00243.1 Glutamyl-tRNA amidotransferase [Pedobacter cryoconitis]